MYEVELCRPVTTKGEVAPVAEYEPGELVTVYVEIDLPPVDDGAENATDAAPLL